MNDVLDSGIEFERLMFYSIVNALVFKAKTLRG